MNIIRAVFAIKIIYVFSLTILLINCGGGGGGGAAPDTTSPTIVTVTPTNNATNIPITSSITAKFSETLNSTTITDATFTLSDATTAISGIVTWDSANTTATFTPNGILEYARTYTASLSSGITDVVGNALSANYNWTFTTENAPAGLPDMPLGVSVVATTGQVVISWDSVIGATSYNIYWATSTGVTKQNFGGKILAASSPYTHNGLVDGTRYYYIVVAENSVGEGIASAEVSAIPAPVTNPWTISVVENTGDVGKHTAIRVDSTGKVHISYIDTSNSAIKYATNAGGNWTNTVVAAANDKPTDLKLDNSENVHLVYEGAGSNNGDVMYATNSSGNWVSEVVAAGIYSDDVSLIIDSNGKAHVSYFEPATFDLKYATNSSGSWVSTIVIDGNAAGLLPGFATSIGLDSNNFVHIAYYEDSSDIVAHTTNSSGSWVAATVAPIGLAGGWGLSLVVDTKDNKHIAYYDQSTDSLQYATDASGSWVSDSIDSTSGNVWDSSLTLDSGNHAHVSYKGTNGLNYATNMSGAWQSNTVDGPWAGTFNAIAIGSLHISYYDETANDLKYATRVLDLPPAAPLNLIANSGDAANTISWDNATAATGYNLYWSTTPGVTKATGTKLSLVQSPYTHSALSNGTTYYYIVTAENGFGESIESTEANATPQLQPPANAPSNVVAASGDTIATITWNAVSGATGYNIYWLNSTGVTKVNGTKITAATSPYTHTGLTNGTNYYYVVTAENAAGETTESLQVAATPLAPPASAPTGVVAGAGTGSVDISWNNVSGATSYNIYWSLTTGVTKLNGTKITGATSPYTHIGLTDLTTYYYVVTAENASGETVESSEASATPGALPATPPAGVTAIAGNASAELSWGIVSGATSYNIYWLTTTGVNKLNGAKISSVTPPYTHTGLTNGTTYYYVITAVNGVGETTESTEVNASPVAPPSTPPSGVAVSIGDTQTDITWNAVAGATSYNIYWSNVSGVTIASGTKITGASSPYIHSGLTNGLAYYYVVTAENAGGETIESNEVSATPIAPPANAPTNVSVVASDASATITWTGVTGATQYNIYYSTSPGVTIASGTKLASVTSPFNHTLLTNGTTYNWVVTAENASGETAESYEVFATPQILPPAAPVGVAVVAGDGSNAISWTNNGSDSYNIYWSTSSSVTQSTGTKISGATSPYNHTGLTNGTTYYYVVTGKNAGGESPDSVVVSDIPTLADVVAPSVVGTFPLNNSKGVAINSTISANFNELMDATTLDATTFTVNDGTSDISGTVVYDSATGIVTFTPAASLVNSTTYTATLSTTIADNAGNNLTAVYNWSFDAEPVTPTGLTANAGNAQVTLSWNAVTGANYYMLKRSTVSGGPYTQVASTNSIGITDQSLSNITTYYYVISVQTAAGESADSAEVSASPTTTLLAAPTGLAVINGNTEATLTWNAVGSAVSYNVFRATVSGGPYTQLTPAAPGRSFTDSGLSNGTQYYYVVQSFNGAVGGAYSDEISTTPSASLPLAPTTLTAIAGSTWASLSWGAAMGAVHYVLYRSTTQGGAYSIIANPSGTSYDNTGLTNGTTYYYRVAAVNATGLGAYSSEASAGISLTQPPAAAELSATPGNTQATLSWISSAGATSYKVFRSTTSGGPYSDLGAQTSVYIDTSLTNGTTYYYVVDSLNASGIDARSNEVSVTPSTSLSAPGNVAIRAGNTSTTITWDPVPGATNYRIDRGTSSGSYSFGTFTSAPYYIDTGLTNGTTYYYVISVDSPLVSGYSTEVNTAPNSALPVQATISVSAGNTENSIYWTAVSGATSYNVYRRTIDSAWSLVGSPSSSPYANTGVTNGVTYYYSVAAVNASGEGAWSAQQSVTPLDNLMPAPVNIAAYPGNGDLTITWDPVPGATNYRIDRGTSPGGPYSYGTFTSAPYYTDNNALTNGTTYYYVVSVDSPNSSTYSAEGNATPDALRPLKPSISLKAGNAAMNVYWNAIAGATSYNVYRRMDGTAWSLVGSSSSSPYTDTGLNNGSIYYYSVAAVNGSGSGAWSAQQSATPLNSLMHAPSNVATFAGNGEITVTWDPVPGATNYRIDLGTSPGGPYTFGTFTSSPYYFISGLNNATTYYFVVSTDGPSSSVYSSEVNATPAVSLPGRPSIALQAGNSQMSIYWTEVAGATSYNVYRRTDAEAWTLLGNTTSSYYTDTGLTNGTMFLYAVAAVNAVGAGSWSAQQSATPLDSLMLAPENISGYAGNGNLTITWDPVPGATNYRIDRGTSPGGPYSFGTFTSAPYFTDNGLTNGTTYYYVVSTDMPNSSAYSARGTATPDALRPLQPSISLKTGNAAMSVYWNEVTRATSYNVYRRIDGSTWSLIGSPASSPFMDSGLSNGTIYYYSVAAVNGTGSGAWSAQQGATPLSSLAQAPGNVSALAGNAAVTVTWDPVPGVTNYRIDRATAPGGPYSFGTFSSAPYHVTSGLSNGTPYYFVISTDSPSSSTFSAEVNATPDNLILGQPTGLSATSGNTQVSLAWTAVATASVYRVYRRVSDSAWALVGSMGTNAFVDTGLTNGVTYYYAVSAVDSNGESAWSSQQSSVPN